MLIESRSASPIILFLFFAKTKLNSNSVFEKINIDSIRILCAQWSNSIRKGAFKPYVRSALYMKYNWLEQHKNLLWFRMEVRLKYDFANLWNRLDIYFFSSSFFQYFVSVRCALLSDADPNRCFTFNNVLGSSLNLVKVSRFICIYTICGRREVYMRMRCEWKCNTIKR